eukprot:2580383-Pleurochrysis_carterae.AAC.2
MNGEWHETTICRLGDDACLIALGKCMRAKLQPTALFSSPHQDKEMQALFANDGTLQQRSPTNGTAHAATNSELRHSSMALTNRSRTGAKRRAM